jgi:hypothetical protein
LRRFHPEISADEKAPPAKIISGLLEKAKSANTYREFITFNTLTQLFPPRQPLLPDKEIHVIAFYLLGLRQDDELLEPRLATYYFQQSAVIESSIVPVEDLRNRLKRLKKDFPADYEKGTDDLIKGASEDSSAFYLISQLTVPAVK